MLKNVFKVLVGVSMLSVVIIGGATFVEASTKSENVIINNEIEMTAEEYFDTWETISEDELPEGIIPLEFDSEEEAYNYLKENDEEWLTSGDEIFVVGSEEVSEETFNKTLKENFYDAIVPFSQKRKVVSTQSVGEASKGDKGRVSLVVYYDVGRENGKNIITSADAGTVEYDIPDNYNVYVDSISCTISKDKKRANAKAAGIIERVIKIKDRFKLQQKKLNMSGSVGV